MPPSPTSVAAAFMASRVPIATPLSAREIAEHVPQALRDSSVFSARTIYAEHIAETQRDIATMLDGKTLNPTEIRARMKLRLDRLGYEPDPAKRGGLQDLSSDARTNLVIGMQESRARGYAVWRSQQDDAILSVWPADELYRAQSRAVPRHWGTRWNDARAALGSQTSATLADGDSGPFIALKNDPIWSAISRFGTPYPPYDYNSGMRKRNVGAKAARAAGVLKPDEPGPQPVRDPLRQTQSSSTIGMAPEVVRAWANAFGDRARIYGTRVAVVPEPSVVSEIVDAALTGSKASAPFAWAPRTVLREASQMLGKPLAPETVCDISADAARHIIANHGVETRAGQRDVTRADIEALPDILAGPGTWRASTDQEKGGFAGDALTFVGDAGERIGWRVSRNKTKPRLSVQSLYIQVRP